MAFVGVRRARVADADALGRIHAESWTARLPGILEPDVLAGLRADDLALVWAGSLLNPPSAAHLVLVAVVDDGGGADEIRGIAALAPSADADADARTGELVALEVDPEHWREGHGSRLLAAVVDLARDAGLVRLTTWCPLADEARRAFLVSTGWGPDTALRDLQSTPEGPLLREARLVTVIAEAPGTR